MKVCIMAPHYRDIVSYEIEDSGKATAIISRFDVE